MVITDIISECLKKYKINHVFGLQGGAVVHIFDSIERAGIDVTYTLHEQSAALAGIAFAKSTSNMGCVVTTTGPGSTNAVTGLLGAWNDSIPCLFISGQVRSNHVSYNKKVRQVGTQEAPICEIVKPICKWTKFIDQPECFQFELENAINIANEGRPGPVWIDIPLEYQWMDVPYTKKKMAEKKSKYECDLKEFKKLLKNSNKTLFLLGNGIHLSNSELLCRKYIETLQVPFVTTWTAQDLFITSHPLNLGVLGMMGQKGANKAVFDADLLICAGTHLSIPHTTALYENYAPDAKKILINIDENQLKNLSVKFDLIIKADLNRFFEEALKTVNPIICQLDNEKFKALNWYQIKETTSHNSNVWNRILTSKAPPKSCFIVDGGGTALYTGFQSTVISHEDQRIICCSGMSSMGTGLADTVGTFFSKKFEKLYCVIGDGSFFMNLQDLHLISQYNIPVIISVINNNGYLAIRHTQTGFKEKRFFGAHPNWGSTLPSIEKVVKCYDIEYRKSQSPENINELVDDLMAVDGPVVCEIITDENQEVLFKQKFMDNVDGSFTPIGLQDMYP